MGSLDPVADRIPMEYDDAAHRESRHAVRAAADPPARGSVAAGRCRADHD